MSPVEEGWSTLMHQDRWVDVCSALIKNGEREMSLLSSKIWRIVAEKAFCGGTAKRGRANGNKLQQRKIWLYIKKRIFQSKGRQTWIGVQRWRYWKFDWTGPGAPDLSLAGDWCCSFVPGSVWFLQIQPWRKCSCSAVSVINGSSEAKGLGAGCPIYSPGELQRFSSYFTLWPLWVSVWRKRCETRGATVLSVWCAFHSVCETKTTICPCIP